MKVIDLIRLLQEQVRDGRADYEVMMLGFEGGNLAAFEEIREVTHQPADGEIVLIW